MSTEDRLAEPTLQASLRSVPFQVRLPRWQLISVYSVGVLAALSGVLWFILQQSGVADDVFSYWRPLERANGIVHGSISLLMIAVLGSMLPVHVRLGWRARRHYRSGLPLLIALFILALSGAALYYLASEQLRLVTRWVHEASGLLAIVLCIAHRVG